MFPGTSSTTKIKFRSTQTLTNVVVEVTPSLEDIVSTIPASFASVIPNQDYELTVTMKGPPKFIKVDLEGTIHIRSASRPARTHAEPLAVNLKTDWNVTTSAMGLLITYPTGWVITPQRPTADPAGLHAIIVEDPSTSEHPDNGIALSFIRNAKITDAIKTLNHQRLSAPGPDGGAGVYRSINGPLPITVDMDLTHGNGFGGLLNRYATGFGFGTDASPGGLYNLTFYRGDQNFPNSAVILSLNGTTLDTKSSTFQYAAAISVKATLNADGSISGSVTGGANTYIFNFPPRDLGFSVSTFSIGLGFPDGDQL